MLSVNDEIRGGFIFNTDYLKRIVKSLVKDGKAKVTMGGDFNASQIVLIPMKELFK